MNRIHATLALLALAATQAMAQGIDAVAEGEAFTLGGARSRFDVGAGAHDEALPFAQRRVGERGVVMTDKMTGAMLAVPSAPLVPKGTELAQRFPAPLSTDPDRHSAEVLRYLAAAGVPLREVGGRHVTTTMGGIGPREDGIRPQQSQLLWYTTHLERVLNGVPVESSYAYAALDRDGRSITEGVHWPRIPAEVVREAAALQQRLADAGARRAFIAGLRAGGADLGSSPEDGEVRIVHTHGAFHGGFEARAVYTFPQRHGAGGKARILRFDALGAAVQLADERIEAKAADSPKR